MGYIQDNTVATSDPIGFTKRGPNVVPDTSLVLMPPLNLFYYLVLFKSIIIFDGPRVNRDQILSPLFQDGKIVNWVWILYTWERSKERQQNETKPSFYNEILEIKNTKGFSSIKIENNTFLNEKTAA